MRNILFAGLIFVSTLFAVSSCTNIDELSDVNTITSFELLSHTPDIIQVGTIQVEDNIIYIPITYGPSKFPLRFYANVKISADIDRVLGIDLSQEQCLNSIDDEIKFFVMAKSGLTRTYYIRAKIVDNDDDNYIQPKFKLNDPNLEVIVSNNGIRTSIGDTLKINVIGNNDMFPLTLTPEFAINENATFRNFENGTTRMRFENARTVHKIKVISSNGAERIWNVKAVCNPLIKGSDTDVSAEMRALTEIEPREVSAAINNSAFILDEYFVDNTADEIVVTLKEKPVQGRMVVVEFPVGLDLSFKIYEGVELFGIANPSKLTFSSFTDVKEFYMLDIYSGVSRKWKIRIQEWTDANASLADVLSFSYTPNIAEIPVSRKLVSFKWVYTYGPSITLKEIPININHDKKEIYIYTNTPSLESVGKKKDKKWRLSLNDISMKLSKGATSNMGSLNNKLEWRSNFKVDVFGGESTILGAVENNCWESPETFTVTSEDQKTISVWSVHLRTPSDPAKGNKAEMSAFTVKKVVPYYTTLDKNTPVIYNATEKRITIMVAEYEKRDFPVQVYPEYTLSPGAKITSQDNSTKPLTFTLDDLLEQVTIVSEDGLVTDTWTVEMFLPEKAAGAEILTFTPKMCTPATFKVESVVIGSADQSGEIKLFISGAGEFPLTVSYAMTLSDQATTDLGVQHTTFVFSKARDTKSFWITAQDGSKKPWTVHLDYRPQLPGGNLDNIWSGDNPVYPWSSANQSSIVTITGTTSENRTGSTDKAAVLTTKEAVGQLASGSLFLGTFKFGGIGMGLNDPISMTYFGMPFQSSAKLKGITVDLLYSEVSGKFDYGSAVIELVNYDNKASDPSYNSYEYHGFYPYKKNGDGYIVTDLPEGPSMTKNNATRIASGELFLNNSGGTSHRLKAIRVVPANTWQNSVFIPITYLNPGVNPEFTHLHIAFASSAEGARLVGISGSKLKVDNVRLVYEE